MSTQSVAPVLPPTNLGDGTQETVVEDGPRLLVDETETIVVPAVPAASPVGVGTIGRDQRLARRRTARGGARVEVRRGTLGLGPNLAVGLVDVSEDGAGVRLKAEVAVGDQLEINLGRPGGGKMLANQGVVRWCRLEADGRFLVGLALRRRLTHADLLDLAR